MPNRRQLDGGAVARRSPASWVAARGTWPAGPFYADTPAEVIYAAAVAGALDAALVGRNKSETARLADVGRATMYEIVAGTTWPDFVSIVKLGEVLDVDLWPHGRPEVRRTKIKRP